MASSEPSNKIWTILDLITWGTNYLTEKNIDDARLNIELMLSHVLQLQRIQLYTKFDQPLTEGELSSLKAILKRRVLREPLQYILGWTEFMGLKFSVDRRVLIPRAETEILVEKAMSFILTMINNVPEVRICDLGTGSGCIAVSLAKKFPQAAITAIDIEVDALKLAAENAANHNVSRQIIFAQSDVTKESSVFSDQHFHCILANPPYISKNEILETEPEVKEYEPRHALTDESDGLTLYPAIARIAKTTLVPEGIVGVEHAYNQSESVQKIFHHAGFRTVDIVKDYQGIRRHAFFSR